MGHLLKINRAHSSLNLRILSSSCVPFTLTTVQVLNLALTHKKRITVCDCMIRVPAHFLPTHSRQQVVSLSQSSCVSPVELTGERGGEGGGARSRIIRPRESLTLYGVIQYRLVLVVLGMVFLKLTGVFDEHQRLKNPTLCVYRSLHKDLYASGGV